MICYSSKKRRCFNTTKRLTLSLFPVKFNVLLRLKIAVRPLYSIIDNLKFKPHLRESDSGIRKIFACAESGIWEIFAYGIRILCFGIRNTAQGTRNPTYDWNPESRIQVLLTNTGIQYLESGIHCVVALGEGVSAWNPESKTVLSSLQHGRNRQ